MFVGKCINFLFELFFLPAKHVGHRAHLDFLSVIIVLPHRTIYVMIIQFQYYMSFHLTVKSPSRVKRGMSCITVNWIAMIPV